MVKSIRKHRVGRNGQIEFLTEWEGAPGEDTWEPAGNFVVRYCYLLIRYLKEHGLQLTLAETLRDEPGEWDVGGARGTVRGRA